LFGLGMLALNIFTLYESTAKRVVDSPQEAKSLI